MTGPRSNHNLPVAQRMSPEPLERRVLLSAVDLTGTTTLATFDFNGDGTDDDVVYARTRRARQLAAESGILAPRRSSLFFVDGVDGSLIGTGVSLGRRGNVAPMVAAGDFNNDGRVDLAVATRGRGNNIQILLGTPANGFARGRSVSGPANITSLSVADTNRDGQQDLVATGVVRTPRRGGGTGSVIVPDFRFHVEDSAGLLVPPAISGGVTAEAGAATTSSVSRPALVGLDLTNLTGLEHDDPVTFQPATGGGTAPENDAVPGTFNPQPGVSGEAGAGIGPAGALFGESGITGAGGFDESIFILLGNGDGTFRSGIRV